MDLYAELVKHVRGFGGIASVQREMPHDFDLKKLPAVDLTDPGPAGRKPALQGLGFDVVDVDVDLYMDRAMWMSGAGDQLAQQLRKHLSTFRSGRLKAFEVSRPYKRPDRNSSIRRIGMTVTVLMPSQ